MTKFNEEICNQICEARSEGFSREECADACGIHRNTLYGWLEKGKNAKTGKYHDFYKRWLKAQIEFKRHHIRKINESKDWRSSQYMLSITDDRYVQKDKVDIKADVKHDTNLSEFAKVLKESLENVQD